MSKTTIELIRARFNELVAERDAMQAAVAPHREKVNATYEKMQAMRDSIKADGDAIKAAMPKLSEVENEIAKLAGLLGGRKMSDAA
jgi:peptidoglycan hydrolase CwlO-like protein